MSFNFRVFVGIVCASILISHSMAIKRAPHTEVIVTDVEEEEVITTTITTTTTMFVEEYATKLIVPGNAKELAKILCQVAIGDDSTVEMHGRRCGTSCVGPLDLRPVITFNCPTEGNNQHKTDEFCRGVGHSFGAFAEEIRCDLSCHFDGFSTLFQWLCF